MWLLVVYTVYSAAIVEETHRQRTDTLLECSTVGKAIAMDMLKYTGVSHSYDCRKVK